jgi:hypothetical protein
MTASTGHLSNEALLAYWLDDDDAAATEAADEHLMACDACGERLDELIALGDGVRAALRAGSIAAATTDAFIRRLVDRGLQIREYRLGPGGRVNCSAAPQDDLVVSRLDANLAGVERIDLLTRRSTEPDMQHRLEDVPFDPRTGQVLLVQRLAELRASPAHTAEVTLLAVGPEGSRELGRYTFVHRPWAGQPG